MYTKRKLIFHAELKCSRNKGHALEWFNDKNKNSKDHIGDGLNDENAFEMANKLGRSILVGRKQRATVALGKVSS